jgi:sulfite exporter TauE/SafE
MNQIWLALLTGLTTGGISCLAVQGGLLSSSISSIGNSADPSIQIGRLHRWKFVGMFLIAKFIAYSLLGFLLGFAGSTLVLTPKLLGLVQIAAGLFMLATAARIANLHPIFRYFVIQPPRWSYKLLKQTSKGDSLFVPALLGFFTILMPCGVTQAMMVIAVATASPLSGAAIMGAFVLGTSPVFFILGATVMELLTKKSFSYVAAGIVGLFAILSINGGIALQGSVYTLQNFWKAATTSTSELANQSNSTAVVTNGVQEVTVQVKNNGYEPSTTNLKVGVPVKMTLITNNTLGCSRGFTIPAYGISKALPATGQEVIEFTPQKTGTLLATCSMGMYTQNFTVTL